MKIEISMDDQPNFDVAVERAIAAVNDARTEQYVANAERGEHEPGDLLNELQFSGLSVTLRSHFGRSNHYIYTFEVK